MSIPVVEIEHLKYCNAPQATMERCDFTCKTCKHNICAPDCPACAVEANNKAWAKRLIGLPGHVYDDGFGEERAVYIPASDWEQIKKLAEEGI